MSIAYGLTPVEIRSLVSATLLPSTLSTEAPFSSRRATIAALPSWVKETPDMRFSPTLTEPTSLSTLPSIVSTLTVPSCAAASSSVPSRLIDRPFGWAADVDLGDHRRRLRLEVDDLEEVVEQLLLRGVVVACRRGDDGELAIGRDRHRLRRSLHRVLETDVDRRLRRPAENARRRGRPGCRAAPARGRWRRHRRGRTCRPAPRRSGRPRARRSRPARAGPAHGVRSKQVKSWVSSG